MTQHGRPASPCWRSRHQRTRSTARDTGTTSASSSSAAMSTSAPKPGVDELAPARSRRAARRPAGAPPRGTPARRPGPRGSGRVAPGRPARRAPRRHPTGPRPPGAASRPASAHRRDHRHRGHRSAATGRRRTGCAATHRPRWPRLGQAEQIVEPFGDGSTSRSTPSAARTDAGDRLTPVRCRAADGQHGVALRGVRRRPLVLPAERVDRDPALDRDRQRGRERQHVDDHHDVGVGGHRRRAGRTPLEPDPVVALLHVADPSDAGFAAVRRGTIRGT